MPMNALALTDGRATCGCCRLLAADGSRPIGAVDITLHKATNLVRMDRFGKVR